MPRLLNKGENIASPVAAEAVKGLVFRVDGEAWRLLVLVKRTKPLQKPSDLLQRDSGLLYHPDDIGGLPDFLTKKIPIHVLFTSSRFPGGGSGI